MTAIEQKGGITRRDFFQGTGKAIAGAGALAAVNSITAASAGTQEGSNSDPVSMPGKIALEEHFDFAATVKSSYASFGGPEFQRQIQDLGSGRIAEMDRGGVEVCIISLVGPGIQAIPNSSQAVDVARGANDHLAENIAKNPKRLHATRSQDPFLTLGPSEANRRLKSKGSQIVQVGDRLVSDSALFCGEHRRLPMRARSSTGWVGARPDTTAGSHS